MWKMLWRILLPIFGFLIFSGDASDTPTQIFNRLMRNYSRNDEPGRPTKVKVGIYVNSVQFTGDKTSDIIFTFYLRQSWKDPRLVFSSAEGKTKSIRVPENSWNQIWLPDTFIRSSLSVKVNDDFSANRLLRLQSDGSTWFVAKLSAVIPCQFHLQRFPFDTQKCELYFESFGYTMDVLYFEPMVQPIDISKDFTLPQFSIIHSYVVDCSQNYTSGAYPCLKMVFVLVRDITRCFLQFYLPGIIFVALSWLAFWIDTETSSASRLLTGILSLFALVLLNTFAGRSTFVANDATSLDCWMIVSYVFVIATLVEYAVVSLLSKKSSEARGIDYFKPPFAGAEKAIEAKEIPGDGKRKARLVDWFSRICFPVAFLIFNLIYWIANARFHGEATG